jgi:hypothetical protein
MTAREVSHRRAIQKLRAQKMAPQQMTMGKGAIILVLSSKLQPSQHIRTVWSYMGKTCESLFFVHQETKINKRD